MESPDGKRAIGIDCENEAEILAFISQPANKKKFGLIAHLLMSGLRVSEHYDKENINDRCKDVYAMKLFKGGANGRIYCKQIKTLGRDLVIITSEILIKKKSQKVTKKEVQIIERVASHKYILKV